MTLTEEQRCTVTFDLEKAREAVHTLDNFVFASGKITAGQIQDVLWGARLLATSAAEIERLRANEKSLSDRCDDLLFQNDGLKKTLMDGPWWDLQQDKAVLDRQVQEQAARIKELGSSLDEAEALTKKNAELMNGYLRRIAELEDALVEERARGNLYGMSYEEVVQPDDEIERWIIDGEKDLPKFYLKDLPKFYLDRVRAEARRQLQAEGKIGPDATKPQSWQITKERVGLLEYCLETLLDAPDIEEIPGPGHSIEMLRAMLREAGL